ncbi:DUF4352 domain-containing protein [Evansella tamaricis]|uniref:DUF4352 domain-containing protein n=1 Tax=Evansella tamaricis TaxID=2069301 RepID=A0ABS6JGV1_9BACI|nr:DUF4352 domain-containing protein [Evansella tamaricis]MBU9712758.1 DUF4352 domain-containing protein [Evansella tamaricis]
MRRISLAGFLSLLLLLLFVSCTGDTEPVVVTPIGEQLPEGEFLQLFENWEDYLGVEVEFVGRVAGEEYSLNDALQVWTNLEKSSETVIITGEDLANWNNGDLIKVHGFVKNGAQRDVNGTKIVIPILEVMSMEEISYQDAMAPTLFSIPMEQTIEQENLLIEVVEMEVAAEETRLHINVFNDTYDLASIWQFSAQLKQAENTFDINIPHREAGYPLLQSDIAPGKTTSGVIVFEPIDYDAGQATFIIEGELNDITISMDPFVFDLEW